MEKTKTTTHRWILIAIAVLVGAGLAYVGRSDAATGINSQISFQGKVVRADGTNPPDGIYNMQFKIYQDGTSTGGGTLKWTESRLVSATQGVQVTAGTFQVNLGSITAFSGIDWNQDTLWLSMNIGGTTGSPTWDGEMSPYIRFTSVPYALNAGMVGGISASQLVQLSPGSQQTGNINVNGSVTGGSFSGNGSALTNLNGSNIATGTVGNARLTGSGALTVAAGTGLTGGGSVALGASTTISLDNSYLDSGYAGRSIIGNSTATPVYYYIAKLPTSNSGNYDSLMVEVYGSSSWTSGGKFDRMVFKNRSAFQYSYSRQGTGVNGGTGVVAYTQVDGSVDLYYYTNTAFTAGMVRAVGVQTDSTTNAVRVSATGTGTTPSGTVTFDSQTSATNANFDIGTLAVGGTQVISSSRVLQNVTADAGIVTSGTLASARLTGAYTGITGLGTLTGLTLSGVITSTVATGTAPLTVSSTTMVNNLNVQYLNGYTETQIAENLRSGNNVTGGGTVSFDGTNVKWSNRFIVISNGNGSNYSTAGYYDINMPTTGTITGAGGSGSVTATTSGIPLADWSALYYILPIGSNNVTVASNFRVVSYGSALDVPSNWVLLAVRNSDDNAVRFGTGVTLRSNQTATQGGLDNPTFNGVVTAAGATISGNVSVNSQIYATGFRVGVGFTDNVNGAPWYGLGQSNVLMGGAGGQYATQLAGYFGVLLKTGGGQAGLDSTGKFGIGTLTPSQMLDVQGGNINTSGALMTTGTTRITSSGVLQNVTSDASILTSGTITDARLNPRIGQYAQSVSDWNDATSNGWYMASGAANAPSAGAWYIGETVAHNALWITQTVWLFTNDSSSNTQMWRRDSGDAGGVVSWGSWYKLQISQAEQDARYAAISGSGNYIRNGTAQQASSDFNISGNGVVGGTLTASSTGSSIFGNGSTGQIQVGDGTLSKTVGSGFSFSSSINATTFNATTSLQTAGIQRIDAAGNLTNIGSITSGAINGQTVSSAANFTGTLTVAGASSVGGNLTVLGRTTQVSNLYPEYSWSFGGGTDYNWKKVADVTMPATAYTAASYQVDILDANCNFGCSADQNALRFYISAVRSGGVTNDTNSGTVSGPVADYVRLVKTATGVYEIQVRQTQPYKHIIAVIRETSGLNDTTTYVTNPVDGSTTGVIYMPSLTGYTQNFASLGVQGNIAMNGTTVLTTARVLQNVTTDASILTSGTISSARLNGSYTGITAVGTLTGLAVNGTLSQSGGYAYLGSFNSAGVYPTSGTALATAWNFTGGGRDISLWNTDTANTSSQSFIFRQLTGASTRVDLLTLNANGSVIMAGALSGVSTLNLTGVITSTVANGTAPLVVASTTKVANFNADLLDGLDSTAFAAASGNANYIQNGTVAQTANFNVTGNGTVGGNLVVAGSGQFRGTNLFQNTTNTTTAFQVQNAQGNNLLTIDTVNSNLSVIDQHTPTFMKTWGGPYDDGSFSTIQTSDGGSVAAGSLKNSDGTTDVSLVKHAADGSVAWARTWGGTKDEEVREVVQTSDGGYALGGTTNSYGAGKKDFLIMKYTSTGTLSWAKTWGGTDDDSGNTITQTSDGGYVMAGSGVTFGYGLQVVKFTSTGAASWAARWSAPGYGTSNQVIQTSDGGYVLTGTMTTVSNGWDGFAIKLTSAGALSWARTFGGTGDDWGEGIIQNSDNSLAIAGRTTSYGSGSADVLVMKLTSAGAISWSRVWGDSTSNFSRSIAPTSDGGYIVSGDVSSVGRSSDAVVLKYDANGSVMWNTTVGGTAEEYGMQISQSTDGGYLLGGMTASYGAGNKDNMLAKLNTAGTITDCPATMCQTVSSAADNAISITNATNATALNSITTATLTDISSSGTSNSSKIGAVGQVNSSVLSVKDSAGQAYVQFNTSSSATQLQVSGAVGIQTTSHVALQIQDTAGASVVTVDTANSRLTVGSGTIAQTTTLSLNTGSSGTLNSKVDYNISPSSTPYEIAAADFDNDGDQDTVVTLAGNAAFVIYRNNGDGTFTSINYGTTNTTPGDIAAADFDNDGDIDIALTNRGSTGTGGLSIFKNTGNFTFSAKTDFNTGSTPSGITSGDFNKDGSVDIAVANFGSATTSIFINNNNGTATFAAKVDKTTGTNPHGITSGDVDNDGDIDIAVSNASSATVSIFKNSVSGVTATFANKVDYTTGTTPLGVTAGDFNKDGFIDLATTNSGTSTISVLLNSGTGAFPAKTDYTTGGGTEFGIANGDIDGDGYADIVATRGSTSANFAYFRNNGDGKFSAKVDYATGLLPSGVAIADVNKDSTLDVLVTNYNGSSFSVFTNILAFNNTTTLNTSTPNAKLQVIADNSQGGILVQAASGSSANLFQAQSSSGEMLASLSSDGKLSVGNGQVKTVLLTVNQGAIAYKTGSINTTGASPYYTTTGDFNGDGKKDMATTNYTSGTMSVFIGKGDGTFAPKVDYPAISGPIGIASADFDGDGDLDIVVTNYNTGTNNAVSIFKNNGNGTFATKVDVTVGNYPVEVVTGDWDADGDIDMAVTNTGSNSVSILKNNGAGTFTVTSTTTVGTSPRGIAVFGTGASPGLVIGNTGSNSVMVLTNNGSGVFGVNVNTTISAGVNDVVVADVNNDGLPDVVATSTNGTVSVLINISTGFATPVDYAISGASQQIFGVSAADLDGDGDIDLAASNYTTNIVYVLNNNGAGVYLGAGLAGYSSPVGTTITDFNGDGKADIAIANSIANNAVVLLNTTVFSQQQLMSGSNLSVKTTDANTGGLYIQGTTNQRAPLLHIQDYQGKQLLSVSAEGNMSLAGSLAVNNAMNINASSLANDTSLWVLSLAAGPADPTLGQLGFSFGLHSSATGANRYSYIGTGDNATLRTLALNTNGTGFFGNVGIGTVSPDTSLEVTGGLCVSDAAADNCTTAAGSIRADGAITANAFDLAEHYGSANSISAGTIVGIDYSHDKYVTAANQQTGSIGVISTDPGLLLGWEDNEELDDAPHKVMVALAGRVPVRVSTSNGAIHRGDAIRLSSDQEGIGVKATTAGRIVGYAMTDYEGESEGTVTLYVQAGYYTPSVADMLQVDTVSLSGLTVSGNAQFGNINVGGLATLDTLTVTGNATVGGDLKVVGKVEVGQITVNGHIISKGNAPQIVVGAAIGQGGNPAVTIDGTDTTGTVVVVAGDSQLDKGVLAEITFAQAYGTSFKAVLSPTNEAATDLRIYILKTANGFKIMSRDTPVAGAQYEFDYVVMGAQVATP